MCRLSILLVIIMQASFLTRFRTTAFVKVPNAKLVSLLSPSKLNFSTNNDVNGLLDDNSFRGRTYTWLKNAIVKLNLCPFAEKPLKKNILKIIEFEGGNENDKELCLVLVDEMLRLENEPGTSLIVAPHFYPDDFISFLSFITEVEDTVMEDHDLHGVIQIAPFHPRFCFDGNDEDVVDNYTNRSPFPTFHLLREEEVTKAVENIGGDSGKVWRRNVRFLRNLENSLGRRAVETAIKGKQVEGIDAILRGEKINLEDDDDSFYDRFNNGESNLR